MLWHDLFIAAIYLVLILVFIGVGYSVLPDKFKKLIVKMLKMMWKGLKKKEVKEK